eukprot:360900-Chlamydomonas_euryale.AAC.3
MAPAAAAAAWGCCTPRMAPARPPHAPAPCAAARHACTGCVVCTHGPHGAPAWAAWGACMALRLTARMSPTHTHTLREDDPGRLPPAVRPGAPDAASAARRGCARVCVARTWLRLGTTCWGVKARPGAAERGIEQRDRQACLATGAPWPTARSGRAPVVARDRVQAGLLNGAPGGLRCAADLCAGSNVMKRVVSAEGREESLRKTLR